MNYQTVYKRLRAKWAIALCSALIPFSGFGADVADADAAATDPAPPSPLPLVKIIASDPVALEGVSSGAFTVIRADGGGADLSVNFLITGTGTNGVDYVLIPGSVTIPAGYLAVSIPVVPNNIAALDKDKTVILTLDTNANYRVGSPKRAVVTIDDNRFNNKAPSIAITSPADGTVISVPGNIEIKAEANDPDGAVQKVTFYSGDHALGSDTTAPYSLVWSNVPAGSHTLFARAVDAFGKSTLSAAVNIVVSNAAPAVKLTAPANGASLPAGSNVTVSADASDANDAVQQVSFYADKRLIGTATAAPYSVVWSNAPAGKYSITAKATDGFGASATSAAVVISLDNAKPTIAITAPVDGSTVHLPADVTITADASDSDGKIAKVIFYDGKHAIGSADTAPYTMVWSNPAAGVHALTAWAVDSQGGATLSKAVSFTVANDSPTVKITSPAKDATFTKGTDITIVADAADTDNAVKQVTFYAGRSQLGTVSKAPFTFVWKNAPVGSFALTAVAQDEFGARATSAAVGIKVTR